jgi:AbrB family looped-hinge helix DNA binding protein
MRVNPKGQVTIPKRIRDIAGLQPGTDVEFICNGDVVEIVPINRDRKSRGAKLVEHMRGRGKIKITTDQVMKPTRR